MTPLIRTLTLCTALLLGAIASPGQGASFDCAKAATRVEQFLCGSPALGKLDERMAAAYGAARAAQKDQAARERLLADQKAWLRERDTCETAACLTRVYATRIAVLTGDNPTGVAPLQQTDLQETGPHYTIKASFPVTAGVTDAEAAANREIRSRVEGVIGPFRDQLAEDLRGGDPSAPGWQGPDWSLVIEYGQPHSTDRYLAIPFSGYVYTGGAHGMPVIQPLVIETDTGRRVSPEGLFAPGSAWLTALSERCFEALKGRDLLADNDDWLREGSSPKPENYQLLFPGPDGLTVTFAPYSVAPYAAGIQEVVIHYVDLAGFLNPRLFGH